VPQPRRSLPDLTAGEIQFLSDWDKEVDLEDQAEAALTRQKSRDGWERTQKRRKALAPVFAALEKATGVSPADLAAIAKDDFALAARQAAVHRKAAANIVKSRLTAYRAERRRMLKAAKGRK
jgi:hypothetical protein